MSRRPSSEPVASTVRLSFTVLLTALFIGGCASGAASPSRPSAGAPSASSAAATSPPAFTPTAIAFWNTQDGIVAGYSTSPGQSDGILAYTADGGSHWRTSLDAPNATPLTVAVAGTSTGWAAVSVCKQGPTCGDQLLASKDAGQTWQPISGNFEAMAFSGPRDGWAITSADPSGRSELEYSTDGGAVWKPPASPSPCITKMGMGESALSVSTPEADSVYVLCGGTPGLRSQAKSLLVSHDRGRTWQYQFNVSLTPRQPSAGITGLGIASSVYFLGSGWGYLSESPGGLYRTQDGGRLWQVSKGARFRGARIVSMWFLSDELGFALVQGSDGHSRLMRTDSGGTTWVDIHAWTLPQG